jgi:16S rRNA (cytosine967-C5)-methyltransferase
MSSRPCKSAREVAFEVLNRFDEDKHDSRQILHERIEQAQNKAHATDIVFGSIRNRPLMDVLIERFSGLPIGRIQKKVLNVLRIGVYELVLVGQTSAYAAVNEAVNLANAVAGKRQGSFVNAILRKISGAIEEPVVSLRGAPATRTIPIDAESGCLFRTDILIDPEKDAAGYLSGAFSLPLWLVAEWVEAFGFAKSLEICAASNRRPGVYLQPNTLKISAAELADRLREGGVECDIAAEGAMIRLKSHESITALAGYAEGLFSVQDATAADAMTMLAPRPGWTVLDLCAAPGGKTVRIAQLMNDSGCICATDVDGDRLRMVDDNCKRLGISIVRTFAWEDSPAATEQVCKWDAIVLDVPCSNTGVLARRPEARLRIKPQTVRSLAKTQRELLEKAAATAGAGCLLCYSTCSILAAENGDLVRSFLAAKSGWELARERLTLPFVAGDRSFDCDGGYVAILSRQY